MAAWRSSRWPASRRSVRMVARQTPADPMGVVGEHLPEAAPLRGRLHAVVGHHGLRVGLHRRRLGGVGRGAQRPVDGVDRGPFGARGVVGCGRDAAGLSATRSGPAGQGIGRRRAPRRCGPAPRPAPAPERGGLSVDVEGEPGRLRLSAGRTRRNICRPMGGSARSRDLHALVWRRGSHCPCHVTVAQPWPCD
jgi:hypothetical protein